MFDIVVAPWTDEQIDSLNKYQVCGHYHEYTCGEGGHEHGRLIATKDGWICPKCAYKQDWAHRFTADFSWCIDPKLIMSDGVRGLLSVSPDEWIGNPMPHAVFNVLKTDEKAKKYDNFMWFYKGWTEGRTQLLEELKFKATMHGL